MSIVEKFMTMDYGPAPEDPREVLTWLERHGRRFGHFVGGTWQAPVAGEYFDTTDPSTGEKLAAVAQGSAADVDAAVRAARAISMPSHGKCKSIRGGLRCSRRWTTASPFARAATSIFPWWRGIFTTTRAGRSWSNRSFPATRRAALSDKSFRGIFRC